MQSTGVKDIHGSSQGVRFKKLGFKHRAAALITCAKNAGIAKGSLSLLSGTRA